MNGMNISNGLELINSTYNNSDETILITREAENSISCITPAGVSITITNSNGALSFVLIVPPSWKGLTTGLMGNFNGNKSDEFIPRHQVMPLSDAISDRNLHWMFAQTCKDENRIRVCVSLDIHILHFITGNVTQFESLFTYRVDQNELWQYYSHPNHIPVFADEIVGTGAQIAICGNNAECLYDLSQTNSTTFALNTMQFGQANSENVKLLSKLSLN